MVSIEEVEAIAKAWSAGTLRRVPVLLTGETGSGKGYAARQIATAAGLALDVIDLAAIPPDLVESELFGHVKGSFTGAAADRPGRLVSARGIVLLDEVGKAPKHVQARLLGAIESGTVTPVGSNKPQPFTAPVLLAASEDLEGLVRAGKFYGDLYHRIGVKLTVQPLRERPRAVPGLIAYFSEVYGLSGGYHAIDVLEGYRWPGNVRELRLMVETCALLDGRITAERVRSLLKKGSKRRNVPDLSALLESGARTVDLAQAWGVGYETARSRARRQVERGVWVRTRVNREVIFYLAQRAGNVIKLKG